MSDLIDAHVRHFRAAGLAATTLRGREELLRRIDKDLLLGLEQATVEELADWLARPGWSAQTRATYYTHVVGFFRWATNPHSPQLDFDPSAGLTRPKVPRGVPRPVADDELATALDRAENPWRTYILLAAYAGLRASDIAGVRREQISEHVITVTGKGGKTRTIPTHPVIWAAVQGLPRGPVALHNKQTYSKKLRADYISTMTGRYLRSIGLPDATLHRFRHWFGTSTLRNSNLLVTQKLMGHSSPSTTAVYCLVTDEERAAAIHALPGYTPAAA
jgi:integrase/recombinase XerC